MLEFSDIDFNIGSVNPSGISDELYYINKASIVTWPTIQNDIASATTDDSYTQYSGNFTLAASAYWHRLYNTQGKGKLSWEYQGETDCKVPVNKAEFSYPKITNSIRSFAKFAANGDFVFIAKHDGKYYVIGSEDYRATVTPTGDTGDAAGSAKGVTFTVECPDVTPLPTYVGTLALSSTVTINCGTSTPAGGGSGSGSGTGSGNG